MCVNYERPTSKVIEENSYYCRGLTVQRRLRINFRSTQLLEKHQDAHQKIWGFKLHSFLLSHIICIGSGALGYKYVLDAAHAAEWVRVFNVHVDTFWSCLGGVCGEGLFGRSLCGESFLTSNMTFCLLLVCIHTTMCIYKYNQFESMALTLRLSSRTFVHSFIELVAFPLSPPILSSVRLLSKDFLSC